MSFSHIPVFSLEVARQLPLNTAKDLNRKPPPKCGFFKHCQFSLVFCQCKRSLPPRRHYSGFWSRGTWPSRDSYAARRPYCALCSTIRSRAARSHAMRTTYQKTSMRFCFFWRMHFSCQNPKSYGFSGSVNGATKNLGFVYFGFCQCKWAFCFIYFILTRSYVSANIWFPTCFRSFERTNMDLK